MNAPSAAAVSTVLLGTALGDALGLPAEGLSRAKIMRRWRGEWRMRLLFGRGMVSDDTEHSVMVSLSLMEQPTDAEAFGCALAWRLRWWFAAVPAATGLATARACVKLWLGISPEHSGVFSAGNGPAMRSAVIGAFHAYDEGRRRAFVRASTRITHTDPRAEIAALAVAEAAAFSVRNGLSIDAVSFVELLASLSTDEEWNAIVQKLRHALEKEDTVDAFAAALGLERAVSGYAYHTVPVALYAWLRHGADFRSALISVLNCGGDTDTLGAITGGLCVLRSGIDSIPGEWLSRIMDWPLNSATLRRLSTAPPRLITGSPWIWPLALLRNLFFLLVVLAHGLRRLLVF